jgi:protein-S-isoprenylcysteine O-methyltransferase Ste14
MSNDAHHVLAAVRAKLAMQVRFIDYRPPRIALAMIAVALALQLLWPASRSVVLTAPLLGAALATAGFALMASAWWQFKKAEIAICPTAYTARLLTDGVYRFTRNPMYLGVIGMLLGLALAVGTVPFYVVALLYFMVINGAFCPYEEAKLRRSFGGQYAEYEARVRRWF